MRAVTLNAKPGQSNMVVVVKFGGVQPAIFKRLQDGIVAHGRSSKTEFHRNLSPSIKLKWKRKRPQSEDRGHFNQYITASGRSAEKMDPARGKSQRRH